MSRSQYCLLLTKRAIPGARALYIVAALGSNACEPSSGAVRIPAPEVAEFELEAYPVLLRDCGYPACHGAPERFYRVFGPGRTRLSSETPTFAPATPEELEHSYERARSMLAHESSVLDSLLLRKPLGASVGGAEHRGEDRWGKNVYETKKAAGYVTIRDWARTQQPKPSSRASDDDAEAP